MRPSTRRPAAIRSWRRRNRESDGSTAIPMTPSRNIERAAGSSRASMPQLILALDQGTTSSRAIVFDRAGDPVAVAQQEFPQIYPAPAHVEHDPEAIWATELQVAREAIERARAPLSEVAAIGITNQRETTILWERATGRPVAN